MKKFFFSVLTAVMAIAMVGCEYDDSELTNRVNNLEDRVITLEQLCSQMNTNITAMQAIVNALQTQDAITAVTPITEGGKTIGYTITFAKGEPITIYHGQNGKDGADGEDGYTPVIGVDQDEDGVYYWTLDGEWLTDAEGNKIATSGKDGADGADGEGGTSGMPELKIQGGYWYVSYDGGENWERLGRATGYDGADGKDGANGKDGDAFFASVEVNEDEGYVLFVLKEDNEEFKVPLYKFTVQILEPEKSYVIVNGSSLTLSYKITGCDNPTVSVSGNLNPTVNKNTQTITIPAPTTLPSEVVSQITLSVSNGVNTIMDVIDIYVANVEATDATSLGNQIKNGETVIALADGEYDVQDSAKGKTLTLVGGVGAVLTPMHEGEYGHDYAFDGSTVNFYGITISSRYNSQNYPAYARMAATYHNCVIDGPYVTSSQTHKFYDCELNVTGDKYNIWTWGATEVLFENCTFNCDGKAVLVYNQSTTVTFNKCTFNDKGSINGKAAIETGVDNGSTTYNIYINETTINGFDKTSQNNVTYGGTDLGTNVWGNKNLLPADKLNVFIDGKEVY